MVMNRMVESLKNRKTNKSKPLVDTVLNLVIFKLHQFWSNLSTCRGEFPVPPLCGLGNGHFMPFHPGVIEWQPLWGTHLQSNHAHVCQTCCSFP